MPVVLLERLPLPSLKTYTTVSVVLLACAVYYAHDVVTGIHEEDTNSTKENVTVPTKVNVTNSTLESNGYVLGMVDVLFQEAWCIWTLINMAYCCLILFGKLIQKAVFGELRVSEQQHIKDKFWNFVFYKFIFIFGVMNVQNMDEVVAWCAWFSILGFLHLLSQLSKDRFEYLSFSPTTPMLMHAKVLLLLGCIQLLCGCLSVICFMVGFQTGINTFAFMIAECLLLTIKTMYVIARYGIHLWDLHHEGVWESRGIFIYYSELIFEMATLCIDFSHHLHMLCWGNIFLSMASLVICMQLRYLFHEFQRRVKRHKNYLRVVNSMEARFPLATPQDLENNNDDCAICWDKMETARKLPCGHLFHNSCLRSWLEQDTSCPTCRQSLSEPGERDANANTPRPVRDVPVAPPEMRRPRNTMTNHFFHFDGSRYVSWFPSFSVEVTHTALLSNHALHTAVQTSQLDNMARQVQGVFPTMPLATIMEDLHVTRSVEMTIENILEGRVTVPPTFSSRASSDDSSANSQGSEEVEGSSSDEASVESSEVSSEEAAPEAFGGNSFNFIHDDNLNDLSSEDSPEESRDNFAVIAGSRFSKSSQERESMLATRKTALLEQAKRKFLAKQPEDSPGLSISSFDLQVLPEAGTRQELSFLSGAHHSPLDLDIRHRRELAFQAAQRRMQQQ